MRDNFAGTLHVHDKFHKWLLATFLAKVNYAVISEAVNDEVAMYLTKVN